MLLTMIGVLAVILGFSVAIQVVYGKLGGKVTALNIFITTLMGMIFSLATALVMLFVVWPPVTMYSWLVFGGFAAGILWLVLASNKGKEESGINGKSVDNLRVDLRSDTGS